MVKKKMTPEMTMDGDDDSDAGEKVTPRKKKNEKAGKEKTSTPAKSPLKEKSGNSV